MLQLQRFGANNILVSYSKIAVMFVSFSLFLSHLSSVAFIIFEANSYKMSDDMSSWEKNIKVVRIWS